MKKKLEVVVRDVKQYMNHPFHLNYSTRSIPYLILMNLVPRSRSAGKFLNPMEKTPAAGVVLYVYHTDQKGLYTKPANLKGWADRHGYIRGWIKTGADGSYKLYTLVPASYPNSNNPKHIHPTIKEPGFSEYWIDEFVFDDDPLLPASDYNG